MELHYYRVTGRVKYAGERYYTDEGYSDRADLRINMVLTAVNKKTAVLVVKCLYKDAVSVKADLIPVSVFPKK